MILNVIYSIDFIREKVEFEKSIVRLFRGLYSHLKNEIKIIFSVHKLSLPRLTKMTNYDNWSIQIKTLPGSRIFRFLGGGSRKFKITRKYHWLLGDPN